MIFVVERASRRREGRVGPKNPNLTSSGHRINAFLPHSIEASCTVRHNAALGNDPVTCGFESGASLARKKKVFFVVVECASRRREGHVGPGNKINFRSEGQIFPEGTAEL